VRRALLVGLLSLTVGCGVPQDGEPRALDPSDVPFQEPVAAKVPEQPQGDRDVAVYLVQSAQLVRAERSIELPASPRQVLRQLLDGPTSSELDSGLTTAIPGSVELADIGLESGVAVVTLTGFPDAQVRSDQTTAFAQIVTTLDELPDVDGVRFRRDGEDLPVPRGDSSFGDGPLTSEDYAELLNPPTPTPLPSPA
jgi:hypothetical protein